MNPSFASPAWADSFGELLAAQAEALGDRPFLRFLDDHDQERPVSFAALFEAAATAAGGLARAGVAPGDRVLIMLGTGVPFAATLFGCHLAGAIPVPVYPPFQLKGLAPYLERLGRIVRRVEARVIVAENGLSMLLHGGLGALCPTVLGYDQLVAGAERRVAQVDADAPALIQFSSGTTGPQKGVVLTHRQIMANCRAIIDRLGLRPGMPGVSWLPLYHDMGLVGGLFIPLILAFDGLLFSPKRFLLDPASWLRLIDRMRAEITMGPNFAYHLLSRRVTPEELAGLDLSCLRIALNGAEPIEPAAVRAFEQRFAQVGLRSGVMLGVYGLAEATLGVTLPAPGTGLMTDAIDAERLRAEGQAERLPGGREVAAVGVPLEGFSVAVLGPDGEQLGDRREGQIAIAGPSLMSGYWASPEATAEAFQDGWLLTGDLGYLVEGVLCVTGRLKDVIIRSGRNYHPQELELAAEGVAGVRGGSALAFGLSDPATGTEKVVVAFETREPPDAHAEIRRRVASAVHAATGLRPDQVVALKPGSAPKTTSGKRQRHAARELYRDGRLGQTPSTWQAIAQAARHHWPTARRTP